MKRDNQSFRMLVAELRSLVFFKRESEKGLSVLKLVIHHHNHIPLVLFCLLLNLTATSQIVFGVVEPPTPPLLVSPSNGLTNQPTTISLRWNSSPTATLYHAQLATDSNFVSGVVINDSSVAETSKTINTLAYSTKYFWRVRAKNDSGWSAWSDEWSFATSFVTFVHGQSFGTWTKAKSPYVVYDQDTVPTGQTLTIEPGVVVRLESGINLTVNGDLIAVGTVDDSIRFTANGSSPWGSINVFGTGTSAGNGRFVLCMVEYGTNGIDGSLGGGGSSTRVTIDSSVIRYCDTGVRLGTNSWISNSWIDHQNGAGIYANNDTIQHCLVSNNGFSANGPPGAIYGGGNTLIVNCTVTGNAGCGIYGGGAYSITEVDSCDIENNGSGVIGGTYNTGAITMDVRYNTISANAGPGISYVGQYSDIEHNTISRNQSYGIYNITTAYIGYNRIFENSSDGINSVNAVLIENNAIANNAAGISNIGGGNTIRNNIIAYNSGSGVATSISPPPVTIFNDIYRNTPDFTGYSTFYGQLNTTNRNGDPSDLYSNINLIPMFVDSASHNYHLQSTSHLIDAGDTLSAHDPDGTVADIGIFFYPNFVTPGTPILYFPANDTANQPISLRLQWYHGAVVDSYRVQVATDSGFATGGILDTAVVDTFKAVSGLAGSTKYYWHVNAKNPGGTSAWSDVWSFTTKFVAAVHEDSKPLPDRFSLAQNYPNPFNPSTMIRYALPQSAHVTLSVYNTLGERVALLVDGELQAGYHDVAFNGGGLASGVYFCKLAAGKFTDVKKLILIK